MRNATIKPLNKKAYGSIPHLPQSRLGPKDIGISPGQAKICTIKARDRNDTIIVQEKLDGSCCAVTKIEGKIHALTRAGYLAKTSPFVQHQYFASWVNAKENYFKALLNGGERVVGEWLAQAHGTRYVLRHAPFVPFDIMIGTKRATTEEVISRVNRLIETDSPSLENIVTPWKIHEGGPISVESALRILGSGLHGALDPVEGIVYRVERKGKVDFLTKFVRPDKIDGCYLPEKNGKKEIWNWIPEKAVFSAGSSVG